MIPLIPQYYLNILVYSKDRPFQLSQFLDSFYRMINAEGLEITLNILYTFTPGSPFEKYYELVKTRFRPSAHLKWHLENGTVDQITQIIKGQRPN